MYASGRSLYVLARCLPNDLDFTMGMHDARILRECSFARYVFFCKTHLLDAARALDATVVNNGNNIRYRKPITVFQTFRIHSRLVFWDKISFYIEQKIIRTLDEFVVAINFTRQTVIGSSPQELIDLLYGHVVSPTAPNEIVAWIECTKICSRQLKMAGYR
nr:hypothetical protein BaRGS_023222 [Batillaria attramentaria]